MVRRQPVLPLSRQDHHLAALAQYPAWTGVQNLPGYSYKPDPSDSIKNGVYQDFGTYVRTIPTRWADIRARRVNNLDGVVSKNFLVRERMRIQYRFEAYNVFNHVRFGAPNADPTSSNFGKVNPTELNNARLVQMALKLSFWRQAGTICNPSCRSSPDGPKISVGSCPSQKPLSEKTGHNDAVSSSFHRRKPD